MIVTILCGLEYVDKVMFNLVFVALSLLGYTVILVPQFSLHTLSL